MRLFKRRLELNIVDEAGDGIDLGELSVGFAVTQTNAQSLNRAKIEVFNLSVETINRITSQELRLVDLFAGYGDAADRIIRGNVSNSFTRQEGPERITEIFLQDGLRAYTRTIANFSLGAGSTLHQLLALVTSQFGDDISVSSFSAIPDQTLIGSQVFLEPARNVLDMLAKSYGFTWSIQNHRLRLLGPEQIDGTSPVEVNFESGLIGSPIVSSKRLEFVTLLNPAIHPAGKVRVTSATGPTVAESEVLLAGGARRENLFGIDGGLFRVSEVEHVGETRGQQWYSKVVCHPFAAA